MDSISRQLKKGVLDILLLKLLSKETLYGYELMTLLDRDSGGYFAAKEGTLYPVLYRLEDAGYIESNWENDNKRRGAPRKYYSITPKGITHLTDAENEFKEFLIATQKIIGGLTK